MANCVDCGSWIPDDQGSRTCSMCYGDISHGKDGYYALWAEEQRSEATWTKQEDEILANDEKSKSDRTEDEYVDVYKDIPF